MCVSVCLCQETSKWKSVFFSEFVEMVLVFFTAISDDVSDENMYIRKKSFAYFFFEVKLLFHV